MERKLQNLTDADLNLLYDSIKKSKGQVSTRITTNYKNGADYDTKFAYHILRLAVECEQILEKHDLDIECNGPLLRSIRNGEWTLEQIYDWFNMKEKHLEELYNKSTLQHSPDENKIKQLLLQCIEMHYGTISDAISIDVNQNIINDIQTIINKYS